MTTLAIRQNSHSRWQTKSRFLFPVVVFFTLMFSPLCNADTIETEDYVIHYSAFNASFITEDVAKIYNLNRSRFRGMINIAIHKKMKDGTTKPVIAQLSGYVTRLSGSESPLSFQTISEGESIYYLAQMIIANRETLRFDIKIKPTPQHNPIKLSFKQDFYTD